MEIYNLVQLKMFYIVYCLDSLNREVIVRTVSSRILYSDQRKQFVLLISLSDMLYDLLSGYMHYVIIKCVK